MPKGDIATQYDKAAGQWQNRVEGQAGTLSVHDTKKEAVRSGRDEARARKVEHIIKKKDGTIGARNTYGHDPRNVPG